MRAVYGTRIQGNSQAYSKFMMPLCEQGVGQVELTSIWKILRMEVSSGGPKHLCCSVLEKVHILSKLFLKQVEKWCSFQVNTKHCIHAVVLLNNVCTSLGWKKVYTRYPSVYFLFSTLGLGFGVDHGLKSHHHLQVSDATQHFHPPPQPPHPYYVPHYINNTLLPALEINIGTGHKSSGAKSSNVNVIPRSLRLVLVCEIHIGR